MSQDRQDIPTELIVAMMEASYDGLTYTDEKGVIRYVNRAYTSITGITEDEILHKNAFSQAKKGYPISNIVVQVFETRQTISRVIRYRQDSEDEALVTITPIYDGENVFRGIVGNIRDITGLIGLRENLHLVKREFKRELEQKELENHRLREQLAQAITTMDEYEIVGKSRQMRELMELAHRIGNANSTVLITGESGVGKDVFCKLVHRLGGGETPYTKISCGAIPESLMESELFGYEPGAFTGAGKNGKPGIFEIAGNGTVFLDEIGEMPLQLQVKLLTVLQDRKYYRIGGTKEKKLTARIMAATNKNLKAEIEKGAFRQDLYYRLNVIPIAIPALRERKEDILPLANRILGRLNKQNGTAKTFSPEVRSALLQYAWPGNIRELNNAIEHMCVLSSGDQLGVHSLPEELRAVLPASTIEKGTLKEMIDKYESSLIEGHLHSDRTLQQIAESLGIDISTLVRKIRKFRLPTRYKRDF